MAPRNKFDNKFTYFGADFLKTCTTFLHASIGFDHALVVACHSKVSMLTIKEEGGG